MIFRPGSPADVGGFFRIIFLLFCTPVFSNFEKSLLPDTMNSVPNIAYFVHLAHELSEDGETRSFDHLVFFNGHTKYVLSKSRFQDLNICNLADLEGGTPFVIDDKDINPDADVYQDHTRISTLLKFFKDDEKHSPKLFFQISPSNGPKQTKDYTLTMLERSLDVKHPFTITVPFYALPQTLKLVKFARISFGSKVAGVRRKTYPTIAQFVTTDHQGAPTYVSERALAPDVLAGLMLHFDARLLIGAPNRSDTNYLHLSDQVIAHKRIGVDFDVATLGATLLDIYQTNERLLSKVNKYFSPPTGTYAERTEAGLDATRTKVILVPDLNPAFRMREAEAIAKTLFDSGRFYPWIITPASQRTTEFSFSALNSPKVNPGSASEIVLIKPPVNLGQINADSSYNYSKTSNVVNLMAYDYNPVDASSSLSTYLPWSVEEITLTSKAAPDPSGYDTDPGTRFIVDFAVSRPRLRTSRILDKLAKTSKFWPSPELSFRLNRHLRYTIDFPTVVAMRAFLNFCDNTSGHFAYPRNGVLTSSPTSVPYFIRAAKGESDPDSFLRVLQAIFNLKNSEMFPVGNLTAVISLPARVDLAVALRAVNAELEQDYFLSAFTPGKALIDLMRQRPSRPAYQSYRPRGATQRYELPSSHTTWFALNEGEDYSNASAIERVCKHIKATNVHRAWSLTSGTSIIFNLSKPLSTFEYGGRNFTVSPFVLGADMTVSQVTFEPDFDKIFEVDSDDGTATMGLDVFDRQLQNVRLLRTSLGLDALLADDHDQKDDFMAEPFDLGTSANSDPLAFDANASNPGTPPTAVPPCPNCNPCAPCVVHLTSHPVMETGAANGALNQDVSMDSEELVSEPVPVPSVSDPGTPPTADSPCPNCSPIAPCALHLVPSSDPGTTKVAEATFVEIEDSLMNSEEPVPEPESKKSRNAAAGGPGNASSSADKNNPVRTNE